MNKLENYTQLLNVLKYGQKNSVTIKYLTENFEFDNSSEIIQQIEIHIHEARSNGHWIIDDSNGYYLALTRTEWNAYKKQRLLAINCELKAIANCDNISFADLIKTVYGITPTDKNYELF